MNRTSRIGLMGVLLAAVLLPAAGTQAAVRYVALDGSGVGGQTWATAYRTIQAALNDLAMTTGGEIRVKQGTYQVSTPIVVSKAVRILGGFSGTGETRAWSTYRTTVDGMQTAVHCFYVSANATIDGIGILYGQATSTGATDAVGGGMVLTDCAATISNCVFRYNYALDFGAALATHQANGSKITNCTFAQNTTDSLGGGIYNEDSTNLQILDCSFLGNASNDSAAAIYNLRSTPTISRCVFQENIASASGVEAGVAGAILNEESAAMITGCIFKGNSAPYGGAVVNYHSDAVLDNCWFSTCNPATINGGGVYNFGGKPTISNSLFEGNSVQDTGGAIMDRGSGGKIINCILAANSAAAGGGAIHVSATDETDAPQNPQFINCTIVANAAGGWMGGGGVYSDVTNSSFVNCIIWANTATSGKPGLGSVLGEASGKPLVRYSDVQGTAVYPGLGNKNANPMFTDFDSNDVTLSFDSPCLDAGSNAAVLGVLKDYDGGNRIVDGDGNGAAIVDMGALELQGVQDHLTHGQIIRSTAYDSPSDTSPTYTFLLRLETDNTLTSADFVTPGGRTCTIPTDSSTSSGIVETHHRTNGASHTWEYWAKTSTLSDLATYGDGTYRIITHYRNNTQGETRLGYVVPGTSFPVPQPTQKPQITTPAAGGSIASPVIFGWSACTDAAANSIYLTVTASGAGAAVVSDVLAKTATQSGEYRLTEGNYDAEIAFANLYEVAGTDGTKFQYGKTVLVGHNFRVPYSAVYRFWSPLSRQHFYTTSVQERDKLMKNYPLMAWTYEGIAFYACLSASDTRLRPVYRLWSGKLHFFTIDATEKSSLLASSSPSWISEGAAFYAYPEGAEPSNAKAVYRFKNEGNGAPFYTISEAEANRLIAEPNGVYTYKGVAFYAYPP